MDQERHTELLSKYNQSLEADRAATDILGQLCRLSEAIGAGRLTRTDGGSSGPIHGSGLGADDAARRLCRGGVRPSRAPVFLDEEWDCLLQCASDLAMVVDAEGLVLYANRTPAGLAGDQGGFTGLDLGDLLAREHRALFRASVRGVLETGNGTRQTLSLIGLDGVPSRQDVRFGPIKHDGKIVAVGMFFSDITEREAVEAKLRESEALVRSIVKSVPKMMDIMDGLMRQSQAEEKPEPQEVGLLREQVIQIGRLIAVGKASAALIDRLPQFLTAIGMSVENAIATVKEAWCPKGLPQELDAVLRTVADVARNVEEIREFKRTASGPDWVHRVNVGSVVAKVVRLLEPQARAANVSLRMEGITGLPEVCMAQADVEHLFFVLIDGIIRSGHHREHCEMTVKCIVRDRSIDVWFSGDGCCVDPMYLTDASDWPAAIKAGKGRSEDWGSYAVKGLIAKVNGRIVCARESNGRPAFFVALPVADSTETAVE